MTLTENISKFSRIVAAHPDKLTPEAINETVRAIIIADTAHRLDEDRGSYEHVGLQELAKSGIKEFSGVCLGQKSWSMDMSAVMQMRFMCDVLTLLLAVDDVDLAMRYSADVAKAMGQRMRTKRVDYLSFDICERILDYYLEEAGVSDEALKTVFEQTSRLLEGLHRVQLVADKDKLIIKSDCVSGVWLPRGYSSFGFDISVKIPSKLNSAEGDKAAVVAEYNSACIMDVLVRAVARTRTDTTACMLFVSRIDEMCSLSRDLVPVGIKLILGVHPHVYCPTHFLINDTIRVMYRRLFDETATISFESVDSLEQVILRYYGARNGGA